MGRKKDPSQWSESYRNRIAKYVRKHPHATLQEARGHGKPEPKEFMPHQTYEKSMYNLKQKENMVELRGVAGLLTPKEVKQQIKGIDQMRKGIDKGMNLKPSQKSYHQNQRKLKTLYNQFDEWDFFEEEDGDFDFIGYH